MLFVRLFGVLRRRPVFTSVLGGMGLFLLLYGGPAYSQIRCEELAPCLKDLESGDAGIRASAASSLGNLRDREAVPHLIKIAKSDPDQEVQRTAIHSLGAIGDPSSAPVLSGFLSGSARLQDEAVKALVSIGGESAIQAFVAALSDKRAQLPAVQGLAEIGDLSAKKPLIDLYRGTDDQRIRASTSIAVQRIRARWGPTEDEMGVPIYPGARYFPNTLAEWVFSTPDAVEKVAAFYQQRLNKDAMDFETFKNKHEQAFAGPEETVPGYPPDKPDRVIVVEEQSFEGKSYPSKIIFIQAGQKDTKIKIHFASEG